MEGSRHERATLVGLAYFIGGLTAFIWYSYSQLPQLNTNITSLNNQTANVASAIENNALHKNNPRKSIVNYTDGKLVVNAFGIEKILSINSKFSKQTSSVDSSEQGTHIDDLIFAASPSEEYVFFCEKKTTPTSTCRPFIYDVVADIIYPVKLNGERVEILTTAATNLVWSQNYLKIDRETSKDFNKPWLLGY